MTEAQKWLAAKSVRSLIDHPVCKDRRKLRLLAAACAHRMLPALPDDDAFPAIIAAAERYADDPSARPEALAARKSLRQAAKQHFPKGMPEPMKSALVILVALTEDVLEGHTAGVANAAWVMAHPKAIARAIALPIKAEQADILRCIFGNPFRPVAFDPAWRTPTVVPLAQAAYDERLLPSGDLDPARLAVLADALEDGGCRSEGLLTHLRVRGPHVRGCWALDLIARKP